MNGYALALFFIVGVLMLTLVERQNDPGCPLCHGKREHHPKCPRSGP